MSRPDEPFVFGDDNEGNRRLMRRYAQLYGPTPETQRRGLLEIAEGLHAQLCTLHACPTVEGATSVAANLAGAQRAVLRYAEALREEGGEG